MPIYEYQCDKCQKVYEIMQKISEAPKKKCPDCGNKIEKLLSNSAFHLKGGGWYKTDYASSKTSGAANGSSESKKTETQSTTATSPAKGDSGSTADSGKA